MTSEIKAAAEVGDRYTSSFGGSLNRVIATI
jgi:hypothetical protein